MFGAQLAVRQTAKPAPRREEAEHKHESKQEPPCPPETGEIDRNGDLGAKHVVGTTMSVFGIPIAGRQTGP